MYKKRATRPAAERFAEKVQKSDGCWLWTGAKSSGYGVFCPGDHKLIGAHRYAFFLAFGVQVPRGLVVSHKCDTPACVNPDHLLMTTQRENIADMNAKGRNGRHNAKKTHCPQGHEYTPENTKHNRGKRACVTCKRAHGVRYRDERGVCGLQG